MPRVEARRLARVPRRSAAAGDDVRVVAGNHPASRLGPPAQERDEVEPARFQDDPAALGECPAGLCVAWSYESHQPSGCPDSS